MPSPIQHSHHFNLPSSFFSLAAMTGMAAADWTSGIYPRQGRQFGGFVYSE
jgi:hypothetical protein